MDKEFEYANLGVGRQGGFDICRKYGGTHGFSCHKFKCYKYEKKRASHLQMHEGSDVFPLSLFNSSQTRLSCMGCGGGTSPNTHHPWVVKVESQEITGINFDPQFYIE